MECFFLFAVIAINFASGVPFMQVSESDTGFSVNINGATWFQGSEVAVAHDGTWSRRSDNSLKVVEQGGNSWYLWQSTKNTSLLVNVSDQVTNSSVVFKQSYPHGVNSSGASSAMDTVSTVFPSFYIPNPGAPRAYVALSGPFTWSGLSWGQWGQEMVKLPTGLAGTTAYGIFASDLSASCVLSAQQSPMGVNAAWEVGSMSLLWGALGSYTLLPPGWAMSVLLQCSPGGANAAYEAWGTSMRTFYNTQRNLDADITLKTVGVSTDNGAYYYYNTESNKTYEQTLQNVASYLRGIKTPSPVDFKYVLLDSWWYYKGIGDGVKTWEAMPSIFPDGMLALQKSLGVPFQLHNRFWAPDNTYSTRNGGAYPFITDILKAVPISQQFWDDLMRNASLNGMIVYEQDWLYNELEGVTALHSYPGLAEMWLEQMAQGALKNQITIQYCMPYMRHLLQSLAFPAVTQARASDDYRTWFWHDPQWQIGETSLVYKALGLAPSKDVFWTTTNQPGAPYPPSTGPTAPHEPCPSLQAAVSALSKGPVAFGDAIGYTNASVIMATSRSDGILLQPSVSATAVDEQFLQEGLGGALGPQGQVWTTYSDIQGGINFRAWSMLAAGMNATWEITTQRFDVGISKGLVIYDATADEMTFQPSDVVNAAYSIPVCGLTDFHLYTITGSLDGKWFFLGEDNKYVRISPSRFSNVTMSNPSSFQVVVSGAPQETISLLFAYHNASGLSPWRFPCSVGQSGQSTFDLGEGKCS